MSDNQTTGCPWCDGKRTLRCKGAYIDCPGCEGRGVLPENFVRTEFTWSYKVPDRPSGFEEVFQTLTMDVAAAMATVADRGLRSDGQLTFLGEDHSFSQAYRNARK